jgi:ABC-type iron transport system FetAB ATPase subunit
LPVLDVRQLVTRHVGPIDLSIGAGECVCIRGPSGSGKSLLLRALADIDPHQGEIYLDNAPCSGMPAPRWRSQVALVMAESQWWAERVGDHFDGAGHDDWLHQLGLSADAMNWEIARCSTGEKQRLALLRTLVQSPAALLLDEPTGNLDEDSTRRVEALLETYRRERQAAVLWVSHDERQVERVARRSFELRDGRLEDEAVRT